MNDFMKWINPPPKTESAQDQTEAQDVDEDEDLYTMAVEHFDFNVAGSYVGEYTPVFLTLYRP